MEKICAYIDGFNVYHFLCNYISMQYEQENCSNPIREYHKNKLKWCNVKELVRFFCPKPEQSEYVVHYFTAHPRHRDTGQQKRHKNYIGALKCYGIQVISGRYNSQAKDHICPYCKKKSKKHRHEEKETDVALGVQVISDLYRESPDTIIIVSNDTDFKPAVINVLKYTNVKIIVLNPLGVKKKQCYHYSTLEKEYPDRITIDTVTLRHMQDSIMPDTVKNETENETYENPYPYVYK